jgi:hypothetical protein
MPNPARVPADRLGKKSRNQAPQRILAGIEREPTYELGIFVSDFSLSRIVARTSRAAVGLASDRGLRFPQDASSLCGVSSYSPNGIVLGEPLGS